MTSGNTSLKASPLLFVEDDYVPDMEHGDNPEPKDPWCLSCGARVADGLGLERHTRFHGWEPTNYRLASWLILHREGAL